MPMIYYDYVRSDSKTHVALISIASVSVGASAVCTKCNPSGSMEIWGTWRSNNDISTLWRHEVRLILTSETLTHTTYTIQTPKYQLSYGVA